MTGNKDKDRTPDEPHARGIKDDKVTEKEADDRFVAEGREESKLAAWRRERRAQRLRARARITDPRAVAALGLEQSLPEVLGMPAFFLGLLALIVGIGWAIILQALARPGPLVALIVGLLLLTYGVVFGLRSFARQIHGRGSLVILVAVGLVFAMLLLLMGINALALTRRVRVDLTEGRYYSLSEQSRDVLKKVTEDVTVGLIVQANAMAYAPYDLERVKQLMQEYAVANGHIKWQVVDIYRNPELAEEWGVSFGGKAVIKCGNRREEVTLSQDNEEAITSAIFRVTKEEKDTVYYLTGHGEMKLEEFGSGEISASKLRKALENIQLEVKELVLKREAEGKTPPLNIQVEGAKSATEKTALENVPEDAKVVMILGAKMPLAKSEIDALKRYLDQRQGGLFIALSWEKTAPDFSELVGEYGVTVKPGITIDPYQYIGNPTFVAIQNPEGHDVVRNLDVVAFPMTRAFNIEEKTPEEYPPYGSPPPPQSDATALLKTSGEAWVESSELKQGMRIKCDAGEERGAQTVAVLIDTKKEKPPTPPGMPEMPEEEEEGPGVRIVVLGSYLALADGYQLPIVGTNVDFATQAVSWLAGGEALSIPAKKPYSFTVTFSKTKAILVQLTLVYIIPLVTIIIGLTIWWMRR